MGGNPPHMAASLIHVTNGSRRYEGTLPRWGTLRAAQEVADSARVLTCARYALITPVGEAGRSHALRRLRHVRGPRARTT